MLPKLRALSLAVVVGGALGLGTGAPRAEAQLVVATPGLAVGMGAPVVVQAAPVVVPAAPVVAVVPGYAYPPAVYPRYAYPPPVAVYPAVRPYPYGYRPYGPRPFYGHRRW